MFVNGSKTTSPSRKENKKLNMHTSKQTCFVTHIKFVNSIKDNEALHTQVDS